MKKILFLIAFLVVALGPASASGWVDSTLFSPKLFIENKGQFNGAPYLRDFPEVLFAMNHPRTKIFFSKNKVAYTLHTCVRDEEAFRKFQKEEGKGGPESQHELEEEQELKSKIFKAKTTVIYAEWAGANPNCEVEASHVANEYFNYGMDKDIRHDINFVKGYKKLLYKNLYEGIDVEYVFHEISGIKYNMIIHPGADISKVKLKYSGAQKISLDQKNNIVIKTLLGDIIDHAPISFYQNGEPVSSSFELNGNTVSFKLAPASVNHSSTIIIDPWVSVTGPQLDTAYEIAVDPAGNVLVYGDYNSEVKKYNNAGVPQWTFTSGPGYLYNPTLIGGDLAVDPAGNSYCSGSECVRKLSAAGTSTWLYAPTRDITNIACCETGWRMVFDPVNNRLYGAGSNGQTKATWYDPATGSPEWLPKGWNACNIISGPCPAACPNANGEFRHITRAPNGNFYGYTAVGDGSSSNNVSTITGFDPNFVGIYRSCNVPPSPYWTIPFQPSSPTYYVGCYYMGNGIAASNCYIYIYTGSQVQKFDIYSPSLLGSTNIAGGTLLMNSGILADLANNFYVGTQNGISAYTPAMTLITSVPTSKPVYDMAFAPGNTIAACGIGFVGVYGGIVQGGAPITCNPQPNLPMTATADSTPPTGCGNTNGTAWIDTIINGIGPYHYSWSNGATTSAISNLASGTYTCTIIDSSCPAETTVVVITLPSGASFSVTPAFTPNLCFGGTSGSASVTVNGGSTPYTYSWNPSGQSTSAATGLSSGIYSVTITDGTGCTSTQTINVTQPAALSTTVSSNPASCSGNNGSASVSASGGTGAYTYSWNPSGSSTANATGLASGNYSVTVTDANGCSKISTVSVSLTAGLSASVTSTAASCGGNSGTATASSSSGTPPYTYNWSNGQTSQTSSNLASGNYSVTITDAGGCSSTQTITVAATGSISASATNDTICAGQNATLAATGGTNYSWSTGATTAGVSVNPVVTTNYSVIVSSGTCTDTAFSTVTVNTAPNVSAWSNTTITAGSSTTLSATGGTNYSWSTGETTSDITVSPLVTTTYCVTSSNSGCTDSACVIVYVQQTDNCNYAEDQLFVPDAFSPNADTKNDILGIYFPDISCIRETEFVIYDRWGEKVFEASSIVSTWDGTYKGKMMNTAVFVYYMKVTFNNGKETIKKGNISLIR